MYARRCVFLFVLTLLNPSEDSIGRYRALCLKLCQNAIVRNPNSFNHPATDVTTCGMEVTWSRRRVDLVCVSRLGVVNSSQSVAVQ